MRYPASAVIERWELKQNLNSIRRLQPAHGGSNVLSTQNRGVIAGSEGDDNADSDALWAHSPSPEFPAVPVSDTPCQLNRESTR